MVTINFNVVFGLLARRKIFQAYLHKLIEIDATHLSDKYSNILLMAMTTDGNGKLIPFGFSIAEVKCAPT